jgi:hypothetical protein
MVAIAHRATVVLSFDFGHALGEVPDVVPNVVDTAEPILDPV